MLNSKKKLAGTQKCSAQWNILGKAMSHNSIKMGVPMSFYI